MKKDQLARKMAKLFSSRPNKTEVDQIVLIFFTQNKIKWSSNAKGRIGLKNSERKKNTLLSVNLKQMPQLGDVSGFFSVDRGERSSWIWADALGVKSISHTNAKDSWLALDMIKTAAAAGTAFQVWEEAGDHQRSELPVREGQLRWTRDFQNNVRYCSVSLL